MISWLDPFITTLGPLFKPAQPLKGTHKETGDRSMPSSKGWFYRDFARLTGGYWVRGQVEYRGKGLLELFIPKLGQVFIHFPDQKGKPDQTGQSLSDSG